MTRPTSARLAFGVALAVAALVGWSPAPVAAQTTGTLVGVVKDAASQRPLEAVQVYIGGTGIGALTNAAGRFLLLNVPAGEHALAADLVGYRSGALTVTVTAGQSSVADFGLSQTAITLNEIVVTGAGVATEKRKLGNTIATIDASALDNAPIANFSQMIAGREPGVVSLPSSGYTGEGARIRIRGSASLSQLNEPIIYVDGIRVDRSAVQSFNGQGSPSRLDDIPPESIERVEILKGAAAATLYGTEASNGVIQIFTKRGRAGAPRFTAQADLTNIVAPTNRILPVADFAESAADQARIAARWGRNVQLFEPFQEDIIPDMLGSGFGQIYSASVSGGSNAFQYFVSGRLTDEDGPFDAAKNFPVVEGLEPEEDSNRRASVTTNFTIIPSSKIRIGVSTLFSDMEHHTPDNSNNIYGVFSSQLMTQLRLATPDNYYGNPAFATGRENMYQLNFVNSQHFAGSTTIGFTPTDNFRLDGTFGLDFTSDDAVAFRPYAWNVDGFSGSTPDGNRTVRENRSREITTDLKGSHTFQTNMWENTLLFGGQGFIRQRQSAGGGGRDFPGPGLETLSALASESSSESWLRVTQIGGYLQDQLGWDDWVFLTVGGRWDANSAFGEDFETAFYPKVSVSIVPSQGLDWTSETVSTFRIRSALGKSGLQPGAFDKFTTFSPQPSAEGPGVRPSNLGNSALRPEVSTEWEVGAEVGLFNDKWSVDMTYWNRKVTDALVARQFPVTGGFTSTQLDNIGEMQASGVEISLRGALIQSESLSLNVFANTAYLQETITSMGGAPALKTGGSYPRYRNYLVEGSTPGAFFGAKIADVAIPLNLDGSCTEPSLAQALAYFAGPVNPSSFKPLAIGNNGSNNTFGDPNGQFASNNCGEGLLESYLGKPSPSWAGSAGFNMSFAGNFELSTLFEYKFGHQVQDLSGMFRRANSVIGRNTPRSAELESIMKNPASSAQARLDAAVSWAREVEGLSPMSGMNGVFDASWIQLREVSLTYRVPADIVSGWGLSTATVNLGARNLKMFMLGDYTGMDPEGNVLGRCNGGLNCNFLDSTEGWGIPIPRRLTLSTRVTF
ncbi:MAG: SusC/RagA family TonB-linked outer membrane protein [Gemmatimonadales bacterium]|nr:SusC/RagA family TonB-linked outer membrane protein [Gemmatimonadales bacterium]MBT3775221.1 SusC/RagA family TonB-linked outer membrane protein [Gemmatimonadales bacterium]MBT3956860.1 SusC/RagA family TonB-linked outer membrane protein [Gemmatimonadales bacterium]MBT4185898.1 SusC/RagA family TonB-linked outer membrane protein [Gemmatimonadales bacterium]MBT4436693.1 SusC/RagA family TonB-linked outer membrane protein [Gemmatimonadales bacterium]